MFAALSLPLPAAFQELLADTPCVGRCLHVDRTVMSGRAEQREETLRSAEQQLPFGWSRTAPVAASAPVPRSALLSTPEAALPARPERPPLAPGPPCKRHLFLRALRLLRSASSSSSSSSSALPASSRPSSQSLYDATRDRFPPAASSWRSRRFCAASTSSPSRETRGAGALKTCCSAPRARSTSPPASPLGLVPDSRCRDSSLAAAIVAAAPHGPPTSLSNRNPAPGAPP